MTNPQTGKLRQAIERFLTTSIAGKFWRDKIVEIGEAIESAESTYYNAFAQAIKNAKGIPDEIKRILPLASGKGKQGGILSAVGFASQLGGQAAASLFAPYAKLLNYGIDQSAKSSRLDLPTAISANWRYPEDKDLYQSDISDLGWNAERVKVVTKMMRPRIPEGGQQALLLRKAIDEGSYDAEMTAKGYLPEDIAKIKELMHVIPGIPDLITMAVRDTWNEEAVQRFGYDEDYPPEVGVWAAKQGLDEEWSKRYWRAHWNLPSPQMGYEMMHRLREGVAKDPFTRETMEIMLRIGDYPKFFRDKMIEISYNPYTRVDVRRMYKLGILDRDQVKGCYLDLGYDEIHAENMTEFTIKFETGAGDSSPDKYNDVSFALMQRAYILDMITMEDYKNHLKALKYSEDEINLVTSLTDASKVIDRIPDKFPSYIQENENFISKAYTSRMISKTEATRQLSDIGYTQKAIDVLLALSDYNYQASQKGRAIGLIETAYNNGSYDRGAAVSELGKLGLAGTEQDQLMTEFDTAKKHRAKHMSAADYKKCYQQGVIQEGEYKNYLVNEGYTDYDITLIMKLATPTEEV